MPGRGISAGLMSWKLVIGDQFVQIGDALDRRQQAGDEFLDLRRFLGADLFQGGRVGRFGFLARRRRVALAPHFLEIAVGNGDGHLDRLGHQADGVFDHVLHARKIALLGLRIFVFVVRAFRGSTARQRGGRIDVGLIAGASAAGGAGALVTAAAALFAPLDRHPLRGLIRNGVRGLLVAQHHGGLDGQVGNERKGVEDVPFIFFLVLSLHREVGIFAAGAAVFQVAGIGHARIEIDDGDAVGLQSGHGRTDQVADCIDLLTLRWPAEPRALTATEAVLTGFWPKPVLVSVSMITEALFDPRHRADGQRKLLLQGGPMPLLSLLDPFRRGCLHRRTLSK